MISLKTALKLLDTDRIERFVIKLENDDHIKADRERISAIIKEYNEKDPDHPIQVKHWEELAEFYRQVRDYLETQNLIIAGIIMTLVFISVSNTMGMSVFERTGEIGTARALGDSPIDLIKQFLIEGTILISISCILGVIFSSAMAKILTSLKIEFASPGASTPLILGFKFLPKHYLISVVLCYVTGIFATLIPTLRATRINIVEALRKNV